jgi:hypothetical protein
MELTTQQSQILETGLWAGRQQAFAMIAGKCSATKAASLKEIRESRAFESIGLTWDEFCLRHAGISRATADAIIRRYTDLGANYFRLAEICRVSPETYQAVAASIEGETIDLDGEKLALIPENAPKIRAGIRRLRARLNEALDKQTRAALDLNHRAERLAVDIMKYNQLRNDPLISNLLVSITQSAATRFHGLSKAIQDGGQSNA